MPCTRPSASASRANTACARSLARAGSPVAASISSRTSPQFRCGVLLLGHHAHAPRGDRVAADAAHLEVESRHPEARQGRAHRALVGAGVQQRAQQHVAREAGDGVHVEEPGHRAPPAARAMRAAIVPAPKPSSMFTTATPAAQEVSIASSADTPPNEAP